LIDQGQQIEVNLIANLHEITLEIDDQYQGMDDHTKFVSVDPEPNEEPTAVAGTLEIVDELTTVHLIGENSSDPEDDVLQYNWQVTEVVLEGEIDDIDIIHDSEYFSNARYNALELPGNTYSVQVFELTVSDPYQDDDDESVIKIIKNVNQPPSIDGDRTTNYNEDIYLEYSECGYSGSYNISHIVSDSDVGDNLIVEILCQDINGDILINSEEFINLSDGEGQIDQTLDFDSEGQYSCTITVTDIWEMITGSEENYDDNESITIQHDINVLLPDTMVDLPNAELIVSEFDYDIDNENIIVEFELDGCSSNSASESEINQYSWTINNEIFENCTECECNDQIILNSDASTIYIEAELTIIDCYGLESTDDEIIVININQPPICENLPESMPVRIEELVNFKVDEYCFDPNEDIGDRIDSCEFIQNTEAEGCTDINFDLNNDCEIEFQLPDVIDNLSQLEEDICFIMDVADSFDATTQKLLRFKYETCNSDDIPLLIDGNNLVSFTCFPYNTSMEQFFNDNENINFIISQGLGIFKMDDGTLSGNLTEFDYHKGYWINTDDCDGESCEHILNLNGVKVTDNVIYDLEDGNNLIGVHGFSETTAEIFETFGGEEFASLHFDYIIGQGLGLFFTDVDQDGDREWSGNLSQLEPNHGYWLQNDSIRTMQFTFPEHDESISREIVYQPEIRSEFKANQSMEQSFYLANEIIIDGNSAQYGDILLSYNENVLTGSAVIEDGPTTIAVMGRDMTDETIGFHEVGQSPQFKVYLQNSDEIIELISSNNAGWASMSMHQMDRLMGEVPKVIVNEFSFNTPYPNPFNPVTTFSYGLPNEGKVTITVYNLNGEKVTELLNDIQTSGIYNMDWNAGLVSAGVYFINLEVNEINGTKYQQTQKVILLK